LSSQRVVLDTNVFIVEMAKFGLKGTFGTADPAQLSSRNEVFEALNHAGHVLAISPLVLEEYWRKLTELGGGASVVHVIVRRLSELRQAGRLVRSNVALEPTALDDIEAKDRHVVACAVGARASFLVTRDGSHLVSKAATDLLGRKYGITAMRPREYEKLCSRYADSAASASVGSRGT
jgi:predicted nucleic acid-binding protein